MRKELFLKIAEEVFNPKLDWFGNLDVLEKVFDEYSNKESEKFIKQVSEIVKKYKAVNHKIDKRKSDLTLFITTNNRKLVDEIHTFILDYNSKTQFEKFAPKTNKFEKQKYKYGINIADILWWDDDKGLFEITKFIQ